MCERGKYKRKGYKGEYIREGMRKRLFDEVCGVKRCERIRVREGRRK